MMLKLINNVFLGKVLHMHAILIQFAASENLEEGSSGGSAGGLGGGGVDHLLLLFFS